MSDTAGDTLGDAYITVQADNSQLASGLAEAREITQTELQGVGEEVISTGRMGSEAMRGIGSGAEGAAGGVRELTREAMEGYHVFHGLEAIGTGSLRGMMMGLRGLSGLFGEVGLAAGVAVGGGLLLGKMLSEMYNLMHPIEEGAVNARGAIKSVHEEMQKLNEVSMEHLKETLKEIEDQMVSMKKWADLNSSDVAEMHKTDFERRRLGIDAMAPGADRDVAKAKLDAEEKISDLTDKRDAIVARLTATEKEGARYHAESEALGKREVENKNDLESLTAGMRATGGGTYEEIQEAARLRETDKELAKERKMLDAKIRMNKESQDEIANARDLADSLKPKQVENINKEKRLKIAAAQEIEDKRLQKEADARVMFEAREHLKDVEASAQKAREEIRRGSMLGSAQDISKSAQNSVFADLQKQQVDLLKVLVDTAKKQLAEAESFMVVSQ